ncbi:MAG: DUF4145 domain-containing protein [Thermosynechococcaceae cyanobacterium]
MQSVSGKGICGGCSDTSKIWLMEPATVTQKGEMSRWQEVWISPPVQDPASEAPPEVDDDEYRQVFKEATKTLGISPRASAVLSRYALQRILRNKAGVKNGSLNSEIKEALASDKLPSHLTERLYCFRDIGNMSAHPDENPKTGELLTIAPGEAEFLLVTLRDFLDFYFVKPAMLKRQQERVNELREEAGQKPTDWSTGKPVESQ